MATSSPGEAVSVTTVSSPDIADGIRQYMQLLAWLGERHSGIFKQEEAAHKNYVVASGEPENPQIMFFSKKSQVKHFLKENPLAVFDYRYSGLVEWIW
jgi:hypothetical protein